MGEKGKKKLEGRIGIMYFAIQSKVNVIMLRRASKIDDKSLQVNGIRGRRTTIKQLIDTRPPLERVLLVGAARKGSPDAIHLEEHLDELASLADTAGAQVVGRLTQRIVSPASRYYIGEGKVEELRLLAEETAATLVVFDDELSPAQGKNLEAAISRRVMDRAELILDIFAHRARTKEARMQIELAQLQYLLPRLARMWVHLSRIRGGIGLRGPGETQIETDRRMIRKKISTLKEKLEHVAQNREVLRRGRRDVPTAVLVGYTNAGKSSLMRALTGTETFVENRLFATLDTLSREVSLPPGLSPDPSLPRDARDGASGSLPPVPLPAGKGGRQTDGRGLRASGRVRLIDTVGFIRKLPHGLVASFSATLEEVERADVLLHVIDASHPEWEDQVEVVDRTLGDLQGSNGEDPAPRTPHPAPIVHVFNKMDLVPDPAAFRAAVGARFERVVFVSAEQHETSELKREIARLGAS